MRMLNSDSRSRSAVGRIACERGEASVRPPRRPPTMRISAPLATQAAAALLAPCELGLAQPLGIVGTALHAPFLVPRPFTIILRRPRSGPRRMLVPAILAICGPRPSRLAICDRSHLRTTDLLLW